MSGLSISQISHAFDGKTVLSDVSFRQASGEVLAILGPSGCGKSTLLSIIAGLIVPDHGQVSWDQQDLVRVPAHQRGFGLMFQDYALFPHLSVSGNVSFGLKMQAQPRDMVQRTVAETLHLVGLPGFESRDVYTLSGGEQQRVALARALAPRPKLLMLDEPLGSLDRALRQHLLQDLRGIVRHARQTTLYVTHDQEEAYSLADRIVVMRAGQVAQIDTPYQIYHQPASAFVARFVGLENLIPGEAQGDWVQTSLGRLPLKTPTHGTVLVLLRPDTARLDGQGSEITGRVDEVVFRGESCLVRMTAGPEDLALSFELPSSEKLPQAGEQVCFCLRTGEGLQWFGVEDDERA